MLCRISNLVHGRPTSLLNAAPVEVVAHVQDVLRVLERCTGLEGVGHQHLRLIVHPGHVATRRITGRLATGVEAFNQLLVTTILNSVHLVPAAPWKHAWPGPTAPVVCHDCGTTFRGVQGAIHATPIPNGEDVHLLRAMDHSGRPRLAFVAHGRGGRHAAHALVIAVTAGPRACVDLVAREAVVAGRVRAPGARWQAAEGVAGRRTEIEALEVLQGGLLRIHARNARQVLEPGSGIRVPLSTTRGPLDHLLASRIRRYIDPATAHALGRHLHGLLPQVGGSVHNLSSGKRG
mmetsp:Transcript_37596/g.86813  ORF Transcript_37596/g.86813 Transcript_37596/m.86813 type:complete len:291 (-) Transcript_37596:78-950(-)